MLYEILHISPDGRPPVLAGTIHEEGIGIRSIRVPGQRQDGCWRSVPIGILVDGNSFSGAENTVTSAVSGEWRSCLESAGRPVLLNGLSVSGLEDVFQHFHWLPAGNAFAMWSSLHILLRDYHIQRLRRLCGKEDFFTAEALETRLNGEEEGVYCISTAGRILYLNQAARTLFSGRSIYFAGAHLYPTGEELLDATGEILSRDRRPLEIALRTGNPVSDVVISRRHENEIHRYSVSAFPVRENGSGRVRCVLMTVVPEPDGPHVVVELERTRERLERLLSAVPTIIYLVDLQSGECRFENDQILRLLGYSTRDISDGGPDFLIQVMDKDDREVHLLSRSLLSRDDPPAFIDGIVRVRTQPGRVRWLHLRETPFEVDPAGRPLRLLGSGVDITDAIESSRTIGEQNLMISGIFHHSPIMLLLRDDRGRILSVNKEFERVMGLSSIDVIGRNPAELLPVSDSEIARMAFEKICEKCDPFEAEMLTREGDLRHLRVSSVAIRNLEGESQFIITALEDLTEYRLLQEQLAEARKMEALGAMAGGVAHDFNNILQGILNSQELISLELDRLAHVVEPAAVQKLVSLSSNQKKLIERGASMTGQILEFSRTKETNPEVLDLKTELCEFRETFAAQILPGITEEYLFPDRPVYVFGNRVSVQRMIQNLFSNGLKAIASSATRRLRIALDTRTLSERPPGAILDLSPGDYARLTVYDTGCGIPPERIRRIFDPFFSIRPEDPGTGLGLAVVYSTVRRMKGSILVRSEPKKFTEFSIFLPLYRKNE